MRAPTTFAFGLTISFLTSATATTTSPPIDPNAPGTCFVDSCANPSLPFLASKTDSQTIPGCIAQCGAAGFHVAGLSGGSECFCGTTLGGTAAINQPGSGLAIPQTECDLPCTGDSSTMCGGGFRLSVYQVPTTSRRTVPRDFVPTPTLEKRTCPSAAAPCYVDSCNNPSLPFLSSKSPSQTIPGCIAECGALNYTIAGLSWADECYCGNELVGTAALTTAGGGLAIPQTECNLPCSGDSSTICGGGFRLSIHSVPALARRSEILQVRRSLERRTCPTSGSTTLLSTSTPTTATTSSTAASAPSSTATCYVDSCDNPSLPFLSSKKSTQTVEGCIAECGAAGFKVAGLSWGEECFCGDELGGSAALNEPGSGIAIPQTECNIPCTGDSSEVCGGGFRLSIYDVPARNIKKRGARTSHTKRSLPLSKRNCPDTPPAPCFVDSCDDPSLPFLSSKSANQTVEKCIAECAAADYGLAGLSWADECFCGNELGGTAALNQPGSGLASPQTECNMPCSGDSSEICGGGFRLSLYTVSTETRRELYRPNFRRSLQRRTCPKTTSTTLSTQPTSSASWRR